MSTNEEKLRQEILGDAERRAERTLARARRDAEKALETMRSEHADLARQRLAEAEEEAEARYRAITAGIAHDIRKLWLRSREGIVDELFAAALKQIESLDGDERRESLRQLLTETLAAIGATEVLVRANVACASVLDESCLAAAVQAARIEGSPDSIDISTDPDLPPGLVVESRDGRRFFDNCYSTRLARMRSELRSLIDVTPETEENDKHDHD